MASAYLALISEPEFWLKSGQKALVIIFILIIFAVLLKFLNKTAKLLVAKGAISQTISRLLFIILKWILIVVFFLLILQQIGITIASVWTVISAMVAMIAIGFVAVWSVLSNILCTLMLLIFQPFRIGDEVEIVDPAMTTGLGGVVRNINLMFTTLRSSANDEIIDTQIPNNLFFQKLIRRKIGKSTFSLEKQVFEDHSLLSKEYIKNE